METRLAQQIFFCHKLWLVMSDIRNTLLRSFLGTDELILVQERKKIRTMLSRNIVIEGAFVCVLLSCRRVQRYRTKVSFFAVVFLAIMLVPWNGFYSAEYVLLAQLAAHSLMYAYPLYKLRRVWTKM